MTLTVSLEEHCKCQKTKECVALTAPPDIYRKVPRGGIDMGEHRSSPVPPPRRPPAGPCEALLASAWAPSMHFTRWMQAQQGTVCPFEVSMRLGAGVGTGCMKGDRLSSTIRSFLS